MVLAGARRQLKTTDRQSLLQFKEMVNSAVTASQQMTRTRETRAVFRAICQVKISHRLAQNS